MFRIFKKEPPYKELDIEKIKCGRLYEYDYMTFIVGPKCAVLI